MVPLPSILVVDDDPASRELLDLTLRAEYGAVRTAGDGLEALVRIESEPPDLVISDLRMPRMDGLELLAVVRQRWPDLPFVLVSVESDVSTVVKAIQCGAANYLLKPASPTAMLSVVRKTLRFRTADQRPADSMSEIVGESECMVRLRSQLAVAARSDVNVLLYGETGTGKELAARAIHRNSTRAAGPLVACNCAAIPPELFESEFMGHGRGAFTGAECDYEGLLSRAHDGVLLLDELECLSTAHQAKLLRVIEDGEVRPLGSRTERNVSVRFLAATNTEPREMLGTRALRADLYYRVCGLEIRIPPLRERPQDVPALVASFMGDRAARITDGTLDVLRANPWPGNVRQLRNVLAGALAAAGDRPVETEHLSLHEPGRDPAPPSGHAIPVSTTLKDLERRAVRGALAQSDGHRGRAARMLGIDRSTLRRKIREYGSPTDGGAEP